MFQRLLFPEAEKSFFRRVAEKRFPAGQGYRENAMAGRTGNPVSSRALQLQK